MMIPKNINISWKEYVIRENSAQKSPWSVVMLLLMTPLAMKRETGVKSVMLHVSYWKISEMALGKGESCDKES